jgi:hypothetical protein
VIASPIRTFPCRSCCAAYDANGVLPGSDSFSGEIIPSV